MTRIKVPEDIASSPHDSTALTFETDVQLFTDQRGNSWTLDMLAGSRPLQRIRRWVRDNYPKGA